MPLASDDYFATASQDNWPIVRGTAVNRVTADLPNIINVFAPVTTETINALQFKCDKTHSCDDDHLVANCYGLYATDQMDLTGKWKLRVGLRQYRFDTDLNPLISVPGAFTLTKRTSGAPTSSRLVTFPDSSLASAPIIETAHGVTRPTSIRYPAL